MLSGAAFSIVLAPSVNGGTRPLSQALGDRWPRRAPHLDSDADLGPDVSGHVVICGYGRVGEVVGSVLKGHAPIVVIEEDPRIVTRLREEGVPVIQGNAAFPAVLARAALPHARVLVVALPDPVSVRQVVDQARALAPELDIVVRTHTEPEWQFLIARGVSEVVLGEWELALELTRHALQGIGITPEEIEATIQARRRQGIARPPADTRLPRLSVGPDPG
jgi:CPA2 family monovalent cation:H+ antiporter-2